MWHNKKVIKIVSGLNVCVASSHRVDRGVSLIPPLLEEVLAYALVLHDDVV